MRIVSIGKLCFVAVIATAVGSLQAAEPGRIEVKAVQVIESRGTNIGDSQGPELVSNNLRVWLRFSGEDIAKAMHATDLKVIAVEDNAKNSLLDRPAAVDTKQKRRWIRIPHAGTTNYEKAVHLNRPRRSANAIANLKGEVAMRIATKIKDVAIPLSVLSRFKAADRPYDNDDLKKQNITVALARFTSFEKSGTAIALRFSGEGRKSVFSVELCDKQGKVVLRGFRVREQREKVWVSRHIMGRLPASASMLRIRVALESKNIDIPFHVKDVPLP